VRALARVEISARSLPLTIRSQPIHEPYHFYFIDKNKKGGENNYDAQQKNNQPKSSVE